MASQLQNTATIKNRYNRTAGFYDCMDCMIPTQLRRQAIEMAQGKVLEVGVGTGNNLPYYLPDCEVTGIDFSPRMLEKAYAKVHLAKVPVELIEMDAQNMTFDTIRLTQ